MSQREKKFIKPVGGKTVPKKGGGTLDAEGETLAMTPWWSRRERDGDVTISARAPRKSSGKGDDK